MGLVGASDKLLALGLGEGLAGALDLVPAPAPTLVKDRARRLARCALPALFLGMVLDKV